MSRIPIPRWVYAISRRFRAACRTNDTQVTAASCLALMMFLVSISKPNVPWGFVLGATLFWPAIAFCGNLVNPIPPQE